MSARASAIQTFHLHSENAFSGRRFLVVLRTITVFVQQRRCFGLMCCDVRDNYTALPEYTLVDTQNRFGPRLPVDLTL